MSDRLTLAERDALALDAWRSGEDERRIARRLYYLSSALCAAMRAAERQGLDWSDVRAERDQRRAA